MVFDDPSEVYFKAWGASANVDAAREESLRGVWVAEGGGIEVSGASMGAAVEAWRSAYRKHREENPGAVEIWRLRRQRGGPVVVATTRARHVTWSDDAGMASRLEACVARGGMTLEQLDAGFPGGRSAAGPLQIEVNRVG